MLIPIVCASYGTFKRSFPNSNRYFFVKDINDLKEFHGTEVYLSGSLSMHPEWDSINKMLKLICQDGRVRCVRI